MKEEKKYIPALKYHWLTNTYDWLIGNFFPEKESKTTLIKQANIRAGQKILDFGCGTATLTLMAKQMHPDATFTGIDVDEKILSLKEIKRVLNSGGELHIADWGKAPNFLMRLLFLLVQFLDGFETTADSVSGLLPGHLSSAGFRENKITKNYSTVLGTLTLYSAKK